jgi:hypothetical protein
MIPSIPVRALALALDLSPTEARRIRCRTSTAHFTELASLGKPLWVACAWDQCPVGGLAGECDRRLGGTLSRRLEEGQLSLARGEVALVGAAQHLAGANLLLLGIGAVGPLESSQAGALGCESAERVHKLGTIDYVLEPPWCDEVPGREATRIAADFVVAHLGRRLELLGPRGASTVTLVLPENVRLAPGWAGNPAHALRAGTRIRRILHSRRSVFFGRRRKK